MRSLLFTAVTLLVSIVQPVSAASVVVDIDKSDVFPNEWITPNMWPPSVTIESTSATTVDCPPAQGNMVTTERRTILDWSACVRSGKEGAAGSIYHQKTVTVLMQGKKVVIDWTLQQVQCDNYDEPKKTQCKNGQTAFFNAYNADDVAIAILKKLSLSSSSSLSRSSLLKSSSSSSKLFRDVSSLHPNAAAIAYMKAHGIVDGYGDGTFRPSATINRAEFTKIITIADAGGLPTQGARNCFTDVMGHEWYAATVCWAKGYGAIGGYPDGTFRPGANISFAEAAKIIVGLLDPHGMSSIPLNEPWYRPFVQYLGGHGAIPESIRGFDAPITRGEMAEMIYRLKTEINDKPSLSYEDLVGGNSMKTFCDDTSDFCFQYPSDWNVYTSYGKLRDGLGVVIMDHPTIMTGDTEVWIEIYDSSAETSQRLYAAEEDKGCYLTPDGQECELCEIWPGGTYVAGNKGVEFMKKSNATVCVERGNCTTSCSDHQLRSTIVTIGDTTLLIKTAGGPALFEQYNRTVETLRVK